MTKKTLRDMKILVLLSRFRGRCYRKKDKNYLDKLLRKFTEMNFGGVVLVEFTKCSKEKNFIKDIGKIKNCAGGNGNEF